MDKSIFSLLNTNFKNNWSTRNASIVEFSGESMAVMTVELTIGNIVAVGVASCDKDFSRDVTEMLYEKAVYSAYNKIFAQPKQLQLSQEMLKEMSEFKKRHNIDNDEKLDKCIKMWNKQANKATLLTVQGALESFIAYVKDLENRGEINNGGN